MKRMNTMTMNLKQSSVNVVNPTDRSNRITKRGADQVNESAELHSDISIESMDESMRSGPARKSLGDTLRSKRRSSTSRNLSEHGLGNPRTGVNTSVKSLI